MHVHRALFIILMSMAFMPTYDSEWGNVFVTLNIYVYESYTVNFVFI